MLIQAFDEQPNADVDLILADLAEFLNSEGQTELAMKVLGGASNSRPEVLELHHKLHHVLAEEGKKYP